MKSPLNFRSHVVLLVCVLLLFPPVCQAADLLQLVAPEAVACFQVRDLKTHMTKLEDSEFARRIKEHPLFKSWLASKDIQKLQEVRPTLEALAGKPLRQLANELLGQDVVVALYASPGSAPKFVLLFEADSTASLDGALKLWRQVDAAKLTTARHLDVEYTRVTPESGKAAVYWARFGQSLAISESEALLQRTIEVADSTDAQDSFGKLPVAQTALRRRSAEDVGTLYINPRGWDSTLLRSENNVPAPLAEAWKRCRMLSVRLTHRDDVSLTVNADYESRDSAKWWQLIVAASSSSDPILASSPVALVAATGHLQGPGLAELSRIIRNAKPSHEADKAIRIARGLLLGLDPINDVLPQLGPHWSVMIVPKPDATTGVPIGIVASIELSPTSKPEKASIQNALDNAFTASLNMTAASLNAQGKTEAILHQKPVESGTLRWLSPIGWVQPSVVVTPRSIVLATSPDLCERQLSAPNPTEASPAPAKAPGQAVSLNIAGTRALLQEQRNWLMKQAVRSKLTTDEAESRVRELDELLKLLDGAYVTVNANTETIEATLGIVASGKKSP